MKDILTNAIKKVKEQAGDIDYSLINIPDRVMRYITNHKDKDWYKLSSVYNKTIDKTDEEINKLRGSDAEKYAKELVSFVESEIKTILKEENN